MTTTPNASRTTTTILPVAPWVKDENPYCQVWDTLHGHFYDKFEDGFDTILLHPLVALSDPFASIDGEGYTWTAVVRTIDAEDADVRGYFNPGSGNVVLIED